MRKRGKIQLIKKLEVFKEDAVMFGRRPDGRRVQGIDPVMKITPYVMPMRCDAQVFLKHRADMEKMSR